MAILCLWELTVRDSNATVVLAIFFFIVVIGVLAWAAVKVIRIAQQSVSQHKNPAYILYSDPNSLNRWGFLYIQYRATAYYFVVPALVYILVKAMFIAFGQTAGTVQAVALLILELSYLAAVAKMKPWMDRKTNIFNISIASINLVNTIFLLVFTGIFKEPVSFLLNLYFLVRYADVFSSGLGKRSYGCRFLHHECSILLGFAYSCSGLFHLRTLFQEPRN